MFWNVLDRWKCSTQFGSVEGMELNCFPRTNTIAKFSILLEFKTANPRSAALEVMPLLRQESQQSAMVTKQNNGYHSSTRGDSRVENSMATVNWI
jgi:hypothetical protein